MPQKIIIGVMGPGEGAKPEACATAYQLGRLLASKGWITLCGGRKAGVMEAVSRGAKEVGGITVGILPGEDNQQTSEHIDIPIITGMGSARNNINVLTSKVIVACGMGSGTLSEVALAMKAKKHVIFLEQSENQFQLIGNYALKGTCYLVRTPLDVIKHIERIIQ